MAKTDYLKVLVEELHSAAVATIGADGHPQTRMIGLIRSIACTVEDVSRPVRNSVSRKEVAYGF